MSDGQSTGGVIDVVSVAIMRSLDRGLRPAEYWHFCAEKVMGHIDYMY